MLTDDPAPTDRPAPAIFRDRKVADPPAATFPGRKVEPEILRVHEPGPGRVPTRWLVDGLIVHVLTWTAPEWAAIPPEGRPAGAVRDPNNHVVVLVLPPGSDAITPSASGAGPGTGPA
jgi:hypothetical protein